MIHVLLIAIVMNSYSVQKFIINIIDGPDELTKHYYQMTAFHNRVDKNLNDKYNIFIGDSLVQGLAVLSVDKMSVNYGIGSDTTFGVIERLPIYNSIYKARNIILSIGHNDIGKRSKSDIIKNFQTIIEYIPTDIKVIICSVIFIDENIKTNKISNMQILELNNEIENIIENYSNVIYLNVNQYLAPSGNLPPRFHIGDGVHLNKEGNEVWIYELKKALKQKQIKPR
jgi:lysophospholipase L1-like esterase